MTSAQIASTIAILLALILAVRGLRGRQRSSSRLLMMAGAWVVIIVATVFLIRSLGLEFAP